MSEDHEHDFDGQELPGVADWWSISSTPMRESEAQAAADWICATYPHVHAFTRDPRVSLKLGMDRSTVQLLRDALAQMTDDPRNPAGMIEIFDEWLAIADPDTDDPVDGAPIELLELDVPYDGCISARREGEPSFVHVQSATRSWPRCREAWTS